VKVADQEKDEQAKETYRVVGSSVQGQTLSRVILKGSSTNPERFADVGSDIELTAEEVADLKASGVKLRKQGDSEETPDSASNDDSSGDQPQSTPGGEVPSQEQASGDKPPEGTTGAGRPGGKR
jgi:hypothetical protein